MRTEKCNPDSYRLAKKPNGEIVLQGAFLWTEGRDSGYDWREIPIVDLAAADSQSQICPTNLNKTP